MRKKGELVTEEILELILAAAAVFLLVLLFYNLLSPGFDKTEETSESYFNVLEEQMALAKSGGEGQMVFIGSEKDKRRYAIVYFGEDNLYEEDYSFEGTGGYPEFAVAKFLKWKEGKENTICICSGGFDGETAYCDDCKDLEHPAVIGWWGEAPDLEFPPDESGKEPWAILLSKKPKIEFDKEGKKYIFKVNPNEE